MSNKKVPIGFHAYINFGGWVNPYFKFNKTIKSFWISFGFITVSIMSCDFEKYITNSIYNLYCQEEMLKKDIIKLKELYNEMLKPTK